MPSARSPILFILKRTHPRRGNCFRLFLPYKLGQGDNKLQPDSVSRWIKSAIRQAYTSTGNSQFIRGLVGISAHGVRLIELSWVAFNSVPVKDILKAAYWNNETTFPVFTCLICQGFLSRSIVSVPFQWPKPRWLADFWGFWICGYCFPQTFSVFVIVFSLCHQWKVFCLLFSAGFVYLFHLLWISRLILSGVFVLFHVWWNSLFGHYSLSSPGHSHVYGLTGCLLQALQPDSHVFSGC